MSDEIEITFPSAEEREAAREAPPVPDRAAQRRANMAKLGGLIRGLR